MLTQDNNRCKSRILAAAASQTGIEVRVVHESGGVTRCTLRTALENRTFYLSHLLLDFAELRVILSGRLTSLQLWTHLGEISGNSSLPTTLK